MQSLNRFLVCVCIAVMGIVAQPTFAQQPVQRSVPSIEQKSLYVFGVVYNFADSVAYISELQPVSLPTLGNQVVVQDVLSERLKRYVVDTYGVTQPVSAVFAEAKRTKAEKLLNKVRKQYIKKDGEHKWLPIPIEKFRFVSVDLPQK